MENFTPSKAPAANDMSHIKGWGIDADPRNDPTYPMKQRTDEEQLGYSWPRPPQQPLNTEVLHSNERFNITAVYGTSAPPSGLSGMIRRFAFRYGEGSFAHWLPLLLADRVNAIEGIADDLRRGRMPNVCAESGMKAQWKYDKPTVVKKAVVAAAVLGAGAYLLSKRRR